jgi:hypothetical protein
MRYVVGIALVMLLGACERKQTIDGSAYTPLPEPQAPPALPGQKSKARVDAAFDYLASTRGWAENLGDEGVLSLALCETAQQYFAHGVASGAQPPLILLASACPASDGGGPMLRVDSLNTNRETNKLVLLFHRGDAEPVRVEGSITLTEKSRLFVTSEGWRIELTAWEDLTARASKAAGVPRLIQIGLGPRARIPMAIDPGVVCVAAVEDRTGRLSNFVPASYALLNHDTSPVGGSSED